MGRKYSIIIPVYNGENRLEACLNSIKNQTYTTFEVLMVNDHSTDRSASICQKWALEDERFLYYESRGNGVSEARNTGLQYATGDIITFCDDDDELLQDALAAVDRIYQNNPHAGVVVTGIQKCKPDGEVLQEFVQKKEKRLRANGFLTALFSDHRVMGSVCNKFFPRKNVEGVAFDPAIDYCEDMLYAVDVALKHPNMRGYISSTVTYNYMISQQSATNCTGRLFDEHHTLKYMHALNRIEQHLAEEVEQGAYTTRQAKKLLGLIQKKKYLIAAETYCDFKLNSWQQQSVLQIMKRYRKSMFRYLFYGEPHRTLYLLYRVIKKRLWRKR